MRVKETRLQKIKSSLKEVPTTTKVRAWTFQIDKQYYVIVSYFVPRMGNTLAVFPSNKKGVKSSDKEILSIPNSTDSNLAFNRALELLVPEELVEENSELSATIS